MTIPLFNQIKCIDREISLRKIVYPKRVIVGKMKQEEADREIATMQAVKETLLVIYEKSGSSGKQLGLGIQNTARYY